MRRFELVNDKSSKFWEIDVEGVSNRVRYGRIGTDGQSKEKSFESESAAQAAAEKLIKAKVRKGYAEVGALAAKAEAEPKSKDDAPEKKAPVKKPANKKPKKATSVEVEKVEDGAFSEAVLAKLRALALPTRTRGEGSVDHMPYIDVHSYEGVKFEETFLAFARGTIKSHEGLFLREFAKLDEAEAEAVRVAVRERFQTELVNWKERGLYAGRCAFLLQDEADIVGALYARMMKEDDEVQVINAVIGLNGLTDSDLVHDFAEKCLGGHWQAASSLDGFDPITLLLQCGPSLVPTLIRLSEREFDARGTDYYSDVSQDRGLLALAFAPTMEAARYLLKRGEERAVFPLLAQACENHPRVMMGAALELWSRSPNHQLAADVVGLLLRTHPGLVKLAQSENQTVLLQSVLPSENAASELPACLKAEPWKGLKPLKRPQVVGLQAPASESAEWPKGLQEEWLETSEQEGGYWLRYILGRDFYRKHKDAFDSPDKGAALVEEMASHVGDGSELDPAACMKAHAASLEGWRLSDVQQWTAFYLSRIDRRLGLPMWNAMHPCWWRLNTESVRALVSGFELDALDSLLARSGFAEVAEGVAGEGKRCSIGPLLEASLPLASSRLVPVVAQGLSGRQGRKAARRWLLAHPKLAAEGFIPLALGEAQSKKDKLPDGAVTGLQILAREGHADIAYAAAAAYGDEAEKAVTQILEASPYALKKAPKLPKWLKPELLAPLESAGGGVLDEDAVRIVLGMLIASTEEGAYPALEEVQGYCSASSLDAFAWSLFRAWAWAGAPSKDKWALQALGWIGGESVCRNLAALMVKWPSDGLSARAKVGVEVLARVGSEMALMALYQFSEKAKTKGLKAAAKEKVEEIAEALGMSTDELADRLVPDLGLGNDGRLRFDVAEEGAEPLTIEVGLDAHLVPYALDGEGARLKKFPKATGAFKAADKVKLKDANKAFKTLAKEAKAVAKHALARLESAMVKQRSWPLDVAKRCFFEHPVMRSAAAGLIWMSESGAFRVAEDGTFADLKDEDMNLAQDAQVHVYHPASVDASERGAAGDLLADYELLQPFEQVSRPVYDAAKTDLSQWKGKEVKSSRLFALDAYGWKRDVDDSTKTLNVTGVLKLSYSPGLYGGPDASPTQTLGELVLDVEASALDAIDGSELVYDLMRVCAE